MINNNNAVASVDASVDINRYIGGFGRLVEDYSRLSRTQTKTR